ncbi:MAG: ResB family protein [Marmoricola sp.]|nr:ResB family protein [Marmoricola sp.]
MATGTRPPREAGPPPEDDPTHPSSDRPRADGRDGRDASDGIPALRPLELLRWTWRQLTSMRTALLLLFLLALGAIPGSVIPQTAVDSVRASQWRDQHPQLTPIYDRLGLFSVYDSVWFSAIYLLLMVSLVGCIVPRLRVYLHGVRAAPPQAPRRLDRLPVHQRLETTDSPEEVLERARAVLRRRRFRLRARDEGSDPSSDSVASERGYLREAGNLLFHLSVLIVLVGFAVGGLWGYKGGVIVVTGDGFANTLSQYDDFRAGSLFQPRTLEPFDFTVDDFTVQFITSGREQGMAHEFVADLTYHSSPTAPAKKQKISVNHPLTVGGTQVFLLSHGYAPHITVRNSDGSTAFSGPVVFLPEDSSFRSFGVVKVTDPSQPGGKHTQIGLEGEFYPTYAFTDASGPFSAFPDDKNPALSMLAYAGNLGLDDGKPQSVYALDKSGMKNLTKADGKPLRLDMSLGTTKQLPDQLGSVTFDGVSRYVKLQVSHTPGQKIALAGVVLALTGLLGSLFIRPRRLWVRARREGGRTLVDVAGLDRSAGGDLTGELAEVVEALGLTPVPDAPDRPSDPAPSAGPDDPHGTGPAPTPRGEPT